MYWKAAPCLRQFAADVKEYMAGCDAAAAAGSGMRQIPLMYAAADNGPGPVKTIVPTLR